MRCNYKSLTEHLVPSIQMPFGGVFYRKQIIPFFMRKKQFLNHLRCIVINKKQISLHSFDGLKLQYRLVVL